MKQNREPRNKPRYYGQLIFDKGGKNIKWEKDSLFRKYCWETWTAACKSMKLEPHTMHGSNLKIIRQDSIKLLEENIGKTFSDIDLTKVFSCQSPKATAIKANINQSDLLKLTRFAKQRKPKRNQKDNLQNGIK